MEFGLAPHFFLHRRPSDPQMTLTEAIDLLAEHGFTALDLPAHLSTEAAEETAAHIRKRSLHAHMTHLPNWRYEKNPDYDAHQKEMLRCAETSRILGVDLMVAHCDEFDFNNMEYTKERAIEFNYRYFYPIVEFAAKHGMKVAFETVFEDIAEESRTHTPCGEQFLRLSPNLVLQDRHLASTRFDEIHQKFRRRRVLCSFE